MLSRDAYLEIIRREGEALLSIAERAPKGAVTSCPGWDMADLVFHIGEVHWFWATVVDKQLQDPTSYEAPGRPEPAALAAWARESLGYLLRVLDERDPSNEVWTWASQKDVAFVVRRMAHETVVHRWDAEQAAGGNETIDPAVASDGIDEFLSFFITEKEVARTSVHLHATDAEGEWLVVVGDGAPHMTREHAKGDAAMRGPAADLLLALWARVPLERVDVVGDPTALDRFFGVAARN